MEPGLRQCWKEQIRACQAPEDLTLGPCCDPGDAKGGCRAIDGPRPTTGKLMQGAIGKTAARQYGIDLRHSKGKAATTSRRAALKRGDAIAQIQNHPVAGSSRHSRVPMRSCGAST